MLYMEGRVDTHLLNMIKDRINKLRADALTMNQESLAECIYPHKWYNPFPKFRFSERPDTSAAVSYTHLDVYKRQIFFPSQYL